MLLIALCGKKRFKRRADNAVHMRHHIRFFRVRKTECRRVTEFTLHNLSHNSHTVFPRREHKGEFSMFFGEVEHFERDFRQDAEATFAPHHNLVDIGARCLSRCAVRLNRADRRDVFLFENEVRRTAVIRGVLSRTASDYPTAYARIFKRLREVSASVAFARSEVFGSVIEDIFELRTADTGLYRNGGIDLVWENGAL